MVMALVAGVEWRNHSSTFRWELTFEEETGCLFPSDTCNEERADSSTTASRGFVAVLGGREIFWSPLGGGLLLEPGSGIRDPEFGDGLLAERTTGVCVCERERERERERECECVCV